MNCFERIQQFSRRTVTVFEFDSIRWNFACRAVFEFSGVKWNFMCRAVFKFTGVKSNYAHRSMSTGKFTCGKPGQAQGLAEAAFIHPLRSICGAVLVNVPELILSLLLFV